MMAGKILNLLKIVAGSVGMIFVSAQAANAASLNRGNTFSTFLECLNDGVGLVIGQNSTINGWQYAFDSNADGVNGIWGIRAAFGKRNPYDIFGMAVKETADSIIVVLNGNMPLTGNPEASVASRQIGWGDLFFNLSGKDFTSAMNSGDLFGIRFADANASGVSNLGVYGGVQAKTVTDIKNGYTTAVGGLFGYENSVTWAGGTVGYGDLSRNYLAGNDQKFNLNAIANGNFLTDITFLAKSEVTQQLVATGYDPTKLAGAHTIAFKFNKSALRSSTSIPEPSSIISLAVIGLAIACRKQ